MSLSQQRLRNPSKNYNQVCQKIIGPNRPQPSFDLCNLNNHLKYAPTKEANAEDHERLTFKDIQKITKQMMKNRKAHEYNLGVLNNIKGRMYCLRLGEVSNYKEFSHYFYTSQYRRSMNKRKQSANQKSLSNPLFIPNHQTQSANKVATEPSDNGQETQQTGFLTGLSIGGVVQSAPKLQRRSSVNSYEDNQEQIRRTQHIESLDDLELNEQIKQKVHQFIILPSFPISSNSIVGTKDQKRSMQKENAECAKWKSQKQNKWNAKQKERESSEWDHKRVGIRGEKNRML